jgi:hypothetical protein
VDVAIGIRDHSGWAVAVTAGLAARVPVVADRRRLTLCPGDLPRQVFHACEGLALEEAARLVADVTVAAGAAATAELGALVAALRAADHAVTAVVVPAGTGAVPSDLATILQSHARLHAAEGELYRDAVVEAAGALGLPTWRRPRRQSVPLPARLQAAIDGLGKQLGPPWQKDHKEACAAAVATFLTD